MLAEAGLERIGVLDGMHGMGQTELGICDSLGWGRVENRVGWDGVGWNGMGLEGGVPKLRHAVHPQVGGYELYPPLILNAGAN